MLKAYLKKKFGGEKETTPPQVPEATQFYSPLRIGLHTTIDINTVDWLVIKESLNDVMVLPATSLSVLAIGEMKNNDDTIYHIYLTDHTNEFTLQLYCANVDGKETVQEATLYKQVVDIVPMTEAEWEVNIEAIGHNLIDLDDNTYDRVWMAESNGHVDLLDFEEKIVQNDKVTHYDNHYLLYSREFESTIGTDETELLLVGVEESDDTAEITMMIGLPVPLSNINIQ